MKIRLLNAGLLACVFLLMLSGCSSDDTLAGDGNTPVKSMKINVSDGMFTSVDNNGVKTRAIDNGTVTSFVSGDAIGIFAVKSDGTVALTNVKYTYNGTSWLNSDGTDYLPYYEGAKYFAYYPYQESLASTQYDATKTTAETFFGTLISSWIPAADQSTLDKYTAQDLMVSMATVDVSTYSCSFAMSHQMSIVEMNLHQAHYTYNGLDTYRFTFSDANKPLNTAAGKYRLLVNPSSPLSITGNNQYNSTDVTKTKTWKITGTTPAVAKYKIYKYNGASAWLTETSRQNIYIGDVNIGDYLYDDGTSGIQFKPGSTVGIIYSDQLTEKQYVTDKFTHGKILALKNISGGLNNNFYWSGVHYYSDAEYTMINGLSPYINHTSTGHPYVKTLKDSYIDVTSGYDALSENSSYVNTPSFQAWYCCKNYSDGTTKSFASSGWYLPSIGEWWDLVENLGSLTDEQKTIIKSRRTITTSLQATMISGLPNTYLSDLDAKLTIAGGNAIVPNSGIYSFWSASEMDDYNAVYVIFNSPGIYVYTGIKATTEALRPFLAY